MTAVPLEEVERRMRPGAFSVVGFLGEDERLEDVLAADRQAVAALGVGFAELAAPLEELLDAAESSGRRSARIGDVEVTVEVTTGFQICPWAPDPHHGQCTEGGGVSHASVTWRIRNRGSGEELAGPGLLVHLVRDHGFFEGPGSPYRVEPEALARLFGLL